MHRSQLPRSGLALGGIGTGWFEVRQDGGFYHWEIFNNYPLFTGPKYPHNPKQTLFFMLRVQVEHENPRLVLLQIEDSHGAAAIEGHEFQYMFPWISGVDVIRYRASMPFAELSFEQQGLPLSVKLRTWSPFIPNNVKDSALPLAYFDFDIVSEGDRPVDVQVMAILRNVVGYDQPERIYVNERIRDGAFSAVVCRNAQMDSAAITTGSMTLASFASHSTAYMGWEFHHPYYERILREETLPEFNDTEGRNNVDKATGRKKADPRCFVTLGRRERLAARGQGFSHTFALSWHFPNLHGRAIIEGKRHDETPGPREGQWYATQFADALAVARYAHAERARLLAESTEFHRVFFDSSLPPEVLDQVNSQLNTFRTSSWLTETGLYGIVEGLAPDKPYAGIATTDVAMYGHIATTLLFPELDRQTVRMWSKFQNPSGSVIHSVACNSREMPDSEKDPTRIDMPGQFVFMALRCALMNNDTAFLREVWPHCKAALAYVLRERDKNQDHLPDMEGIMCSYDNFPMFGVAPYVATQWLAAVAAALEAAEILGDSPFVREYTPFFHQGCATVDAKTWNGSYFKLYSDRQEKDPAGQDGCMADQIIGEGVARQLGLPPLLDADKVRTALRTILRMNFKPEQGLRNCQWPGDAFLHDIDSDTWIDQANTCWTGVELQFAAQLYYAGLHEDAEQIVRNVDARHRAWGMYWDHQEFGGHYYRPMSGLGIPNAFLGLSLSGGHLVIRPARALPNGRWCALLPGATATLFNGPRGVRLVGRIGAARLGRVTLPATGTVRVSGLKTAYTADTHAGQTTLSFAADIELQPGVEIAIGES